MKNVVLLAAAMALSVFEVQAAPEQTAFIDQPEHPCRNSRQAYLSVFDRTADPPMWSNSLTGDFAYAQGLYSRRMEKEPNLKPDEIAIRCHKVTYQPTRD